MQTVRVKPIAVLLLMITLSGCSTILSSMRSALHETATPTPTLAGPATTYASLIDNLRKQGVTAEPKGKISQAFFSVEGSIIAVNGEDVQVFECPDAAAADAEAQHISPDGGSIGTTMVMWVATPHFYKQGRLIVLYVGDNKSVVAALQAVLGPQIAGQ
jgi:hypothetical protein